MQFNLMKIIRQLKIDKPAILNSYAVRQMV